MNDFHSIFSAFEQRDMEFSKRGFGNIAKRKESMIGRIQDSGLTTNAARCSRFPTRPSISKPSPKPSPQP